MRQALLSAAAGIAIGIAGLVATDRGLAEPLPVQTFPITERFPDVLLTTHDGETVRFFEDLVKGKTVAINFMYIACKNF